MKKRIMKGTIIIVLIILMAIQGKYFGSIILKSELVTDIITFLSIIFGFYITSLAIFVTSKYVSSLYQKTDEKNPNRTLLNTLVSKYKTGLCLILFSIIYLIIVQLVLNQQKDEQLLFSNYLVLPFISLLIFNFFYSYQMLMMLINIVTQEAKNRIK